MLEQQNQDIQVKQEEGIENIQAENKSSFDHSYQEQESYSKVKNQVKVEEQSEFHYTVYNKTINQIDRYQDNKKVSTKPKHKRSIFHNFLKHLFTTLKKVGSIQYLKNNASNQEEYDLAQKIWTKFITTKFFTKKVMALVFGSSSQPWKNEQKFKKFLNTKQSYFKEQIWGAQELLKTMIIQQASNGRLEKLLQRRKINNLEYFKLYAKEFLDQLSSSGLKRRFPKDKKAKLIQNRLNEQKIQQEMSKRI